MMGSENHNAADRSAEAQHAACSAEMFTEKQKATHVYTITKHMAYHPVSTCACSVCFIFIVVIISALGGLLGMSTPSQYDWIISSTTESKNNDALAYAVDRVDQISASGERQQMYGFGNWFFLHNSRNKQDIYTPENLQQMCLVESKIVENDKFPDYCMLDGSGDCILPASSIVVYFYGFSNISDWNCTLLNATEVDTKKDVIYDGLSTPDGREQFGLWLSKDSANTGYTAEVNSMWYFGSPLSGYNSSNDRWEEQYDKYQKFFTALAGEVGGIEEEMFDYFGIDTNEDNFLPYYPSPYMEKALTSSLDVKWFNGIVANNETNRLVTTDLLFAFFSIIFVWTWMRVHTKSTFIASAGMYMIFFSIPFSMVIYKGLYQIPFFSELHTLVIFIVLGVGADDIFVLVDSWYLTAVEYPGDISGGKNRHITHRRLYHCYHHTMDTVFNTSFTTAVAFIATGFSPLMPISTFGWFAATCIVANYIFCITLMPPAVVIASLYFDHCCTSSAPAVEETTSASGHQLVAQSDAQEVGKDVEVAAKAGEVEMTPCLSDGNSPAVAPDGSNGDIVLKHKDVNVNAESDEGASAGAKAAVAAPEVHSELEFNDMPMVEMYIKLISFSIHVDSSGVSIADTSAARQVESSKGRPIPIIALVTFIGLLIFGIVGTAYGVALRPPTGQEQWYPSLHMFTLATDEMANNFLGFDDAAYANAKFTFGISGIDRAGFDKYKPGTNRGVTTYDSNYNLAAPACQRVFVRMCDEVPPFPCSSSACQPTYKLARENTTECFMTNFRTYMQDNYGVDTYNMTEASFYANLTQFRLTELQTYNAGQSWQDSIGFVGGVLKFATMTFKSTMDNEAPLVQKQEVLDRMYSFISTVKNYAECKSKQCDCDSLMISSDFAFSWMRSEEGLLNGFYQGLSIAFPVAFLVLLTATGNIIISFLAMLTVFFIVFNVLGFVNYSLGWALGIAESIAGIIIIGFSVDYTVHLGHMYTYGERLGLHTRKEKFEFASRKMVATIVGGAITTAGAGVFMFLCQLMFFVKMATLIVATIVLSYMYALGFFMSALYLMGPEGKVGNVHYMLRWACAKLAQAHPELAKVIPVSMLRNDRDSPEPFGLVDTVANPSASASNSLIKADVADPVESSAL